EVGISTPLPTPRPAEIVLNAFRHHRGGHGIMRRMTCVFDALCSTPFGITEVGIRRRIAFDPTVTRCSTPFGITEVGIWSGLLWLAQPRSAQRLSASQRWASAAPVSANGPRRSAQRLSASQRWAFADGSKLLGSIKCSTPFGITEVGM